MDSTYDHFIRNWNHSEDRNGFSFCICSMCLKFLHGNPSDKRCASLGRTDVRRNDTQMLLNIAIPTALPMIMTGIRVALGAAWTCIVAAEMLASTKGLGYMIQQARGIYRPDIIICGMIAIGAIGAVFSGILSLIENKIVKGVRRDG